MKSNIAITGTNTKLNKSIAIALAERLELTYMDYDQYIEYMECSTLAEIEQSQGKDILSQLQSDKLRSIVDYCNSIFAFSSKVCTKSGDVAVVATGAYVIHIATGRVCKQLSANCLMVINPKSLDSQSTQSVINLQGGAESPQQRGIIDRNPHTVDNNMIVQRIMDRLGGL